MSAYITRLRRELQNLQTERHYAEMANDFAYTDGTIKAFDREIWRIKELIREAEEAQADSRRAA